MFFYQFEQLQLEASLTHSMKAKLKSLQQQHTLALKLMSECDEEVISKLSSCLKCYSMLNQAL